MASEQMQCIFQEQYGTEFLHVTQRPVPVPAENQVLIKVYSSAINISDLVTIRGNSAANVPLPFIPGKEGAGLVLSSGGGQLADSLVGKRVAVLNPSGIWAEFAVAQAENCQVILEGTSYEEASCSFVNPLTALYFLDIVKQKNHQAVILTAASSVLTRMTRLVFQEEGITTINIVRRNDAAEELRNEGWQYSLSTESEGFWAEFRELVENLKPTCAFDAVGGELTGKILEIMPVRSEIYVYGMLSKQPVSCVQLGDLIVRRKEVKGLYLPNWLSEIDLQQRLSAYERVQRGIKTIFSTKTARVYNFTEFERGISEYEADLNAGKSLLVFNTD